MDNYICKASITNFNPIITRDTINGRQIIIRKINIDDFNIQTSEKVQAPFYILYLPDSRNAYQPLR
jgi:hypothetical protein